MTEYNTAPEYPAILPCDGGFEVHMNSRVTLPGYYTSFNMAERAIRKYKGAMTQAKLNKGK